ncbi:alpha/beta fold hydrolase [uncultured Propionibacterium sp.]|uniref:alpha/beta hydrolase family protein n=1 Tax=uncultured Propionibacterium sp. TaxID=218066 RepID=UPI00292FD5F9|nr:alpha/beta fold hydrolase [uncultured Propionibacterium sp.]
MSGAGERVRELRFERDGLRIYGELHQPAAGGPFPVVIISHDFGATGMRYRHCARFLAGRGVACYLYDFCGGSRHSRSDGDLHDQSVLTQTADLEAVLAGIRTQPALDPDELFLVGASQGGYVSGIVAARHPRSVRGLVMLYPALVIPDDAHGRYASPDEVPDEPELFGVPVGRRYYVDAWGLDPARDLAGYDGEVLIIHGDQDEVVPIAYSERAVGYYSRARLTRVPGAGHGFHREALRAAERAIHDQIVRTLGRVPG